MRRTKKAPNASLVILYEGTREECLKRENQLRPDLRIGWNIARGGTAAEPRTYGRRPLGLRFNPITGKGRWETPSVYAIWKPEAP